MKPKFIFTADDFGPVDFINNGIIQCVQAGAINSVHVLVNFNEKLLEKELLRLCNSLKPNQKLDLGIHYTLMSGSPIYPIENPQNLSHEKEIRSAWSNIVTKRKIKGQSQFVFRAFNRFFWKIFRYKNNQVYYGNTVLKELKAQRLRLETVVNSVNSKNIEGKKLIVSSASNHFNLFTSNPTILKAYQEASKGLVLRSPRMVPASRAKLLVGAYLPLSNPNDSKKLNAHARKMEKHYANYRFYGEHDQVFLSPAYLDSRFFFATGKLFSKTIATVKSRTRRFDQIIHDAQNFNPKCINQDQLIIEVAFHLGKRADGDNRSFKQMTNHYLGIAPKYFDNREIEFESLMWLAKNQSYSDLFTKQTASWKSCKVPIFYTKVN